MSLLLDALKKAADDKQKISQSETVGDVPADVEDTEAPACLAERTIGIEISSLAETSNFSETLSQEVPEQAEIVHPVGSEVLTLDPVEAVQNDSALTFDETESAAFEQQADKKPAFSNNTVSDEALALLIHKTNRDTKNSKRIIVISVVLASLAVLVSGGVYYYFEMQAEMASLERKHQIAMQAMRSKTSDEKVPEKSEIIRSFVNKTEPEDRVMLAKKQIFSKKHTQQKSEPRTDVKKKPNKAAKNTANNDKSAVSIQRTNKSDPLGEKLDAAWLAYESGHYDEAGQLYSEVLQLENNNRDALLGMGAVAIHKKDTETAKRYYHELLKQDPRDPIATASLASLDSDKTSIESNKEYLLAMLEGEPKAAHLNFALGNIYAQKGEWKAAQQSYFKAWQYDNENADYLFNLAVSMDQLSKQEQAIKFYKVSLLKSNNKQVSFSREAVKKRISELSGL